MLPSWGASEVKHYFKHPLDVCPNRANLISGVSEVKRVGALFFRLSTRAPPRQAIAHSYLMIVVIVKQHNSNDTNTTTNNDKHTDNNTINDNNT